MARRREFLADGAGSVFEGVPAEELEPLLARTQRQRFPAGTVIVDAGETPPAVHVVQSGEAEVVYVSRTGAEHVVGHIEAGGTFGEMSLLTGDPAAAGIRAATELETIVIGKDEFERLATRFPVVYRNVGALLAERLSEAVAAGAGARRGRIAVLRDRGAPPLLPYAVAASMAWHAQVPVLLLARGSGDPSALGAFAGRRGATEHGPGVELVLAESEHELGADSLDELARRFEHVLVVAEPDFELQGRRSVELLPAGASPAGELGVRGWSAVRHWTPRPWNGVLDVPPLTAADEEALTRGVLPARSPAGRSLGWLGRHLAGLQVGVAMGAGSLRGWAHYGVLSVLERSGVTLDYVAGTSIGAASAATTAYGYDAAQGAEHMDRVADWVFKPTFPAYSLLANAGVGHYLHRIFGDARMEDLELPCALVAADLATGRKVVLRRGVLWRAVLDSMAIPGIYPAHRVGSTVLVDGGLVDPVPAAVCADMGADVVVGVRLTGSPAEPLEHAEAQVVQDRPPSMIRVILDSFEVMQNEVAIEPARATSIFLAPDCPPVKGRLRNFGQGRRFFEAGVEAAELAMPRLAAALPWLGAD